MAKVYGPAVGADRAKRAAAGAPLAKGVKGKTQALQNMDPRAREAAELKTKARAVSPTKGKQNIVTRYNGVVTGSTGKAKKFTVKPRRPR